MTGPVGQDARPPESTVDVLLASDDEQRSGLADRLEAVADRFAVRDRPLEAVEGLADPPDCLVLATGDVDRGTATLAAVRERHERLAVVYCSPETGHAGAAFEAGATDFHHLDGGEGALRHRIDAAVERTETARTLAANREATRAFQAAVDDDAGFEATARRLLSVGRDRLGVAAAALVELDPGTGRGEVAIADGDAVEEGEPSALAGSHDRAAAGSEESYEVGGTGDGRTEEAGRYLGCRVGVDGEVYGVVRFRDPDRRDPFSADERALVERIAGWLGEEIERREYERRNTETRRRLERTLDRIDDAFFGLGTDWTFTYVNERAGELLRRDPDELVGENVWDQFPDAVESRFQEMYERAMDTQEPVTFEEHFAPLGTWFEVSAYPDDEGLSVFFRDVTARKEREEELLVQSRAMEKASIGLTLTDPDADNELVWVNEGFEELTGYDKEEVLGRNCRFLQGEDTDPDAVAELREGIDTEESVSATLLNYRPDGTPFWNRIEIDPIYDDDGTLIRFLGSQTDVTDRVERQRTLADLHEAMRGLVGADTRDAVAERAVATVEEVLDHEFAGVHFHDAGTGTLEPAATGEATERHYGSLHAHPDDDGPLGEAFVAGTPGLYEDLADRPGWDYAPIGSAMVFPLGEHGTLSIGTATVGAIDEETRSVAEILAANATVALDKVERERSLREYQHRLREAVAATRELMGAESRSAAIELAVTAATEALSFDVAAVRRHDPEADVLRPAAVGGADMDRPVLDVDDSPHGRAFRSGEAVLEAPREGGDPYDREPLAESLYLPLGEYGTLTLAKYDEPFDAADRQLAELLATTTESALDRATRREALTRYEDVLETVEDMVFVIDDEGRFSLVTDPLARFLGYDRDHLEGEPFTTVVADDDVGSAMDAIDRLAAFDRETATADLDVVTAAGDRIPVEVEGARLSDTGELVGVVRDRTELERTRSELERERDRFANLFEYLPDPVNEVEFVDGEPIVRAVNSAFEDAFGHEGRPLVGENANDVVEPAEDDHGEVRDIDMRALEGEVVTEEVRRRTAEGVRDFLFRGIPYRADGDTFALGVYTDITEQKRLQRRLRVLNRALRHNVRNEMTVVIGYAELLAEELETERFVTAAEELLEAGHEVAAISQQARAVEKVFRSPGEGSADLSAVAAETVEVVGERHPEATVTLDAPDPCPAATDDGIRLAVENLIENAIVHNGGDAPRVHVETLAVDADTVGIRIGDDGPGIPAHERAVVTGDREVTQLEHGSGLGLWVVKWLTEAAGGQVRFADSDLGGTAVTIELPRAGD